jgi:adenine-specific DNA methylase
MRLGCEATAIDINPVAWFILKCTLEYPQKLAGQLRPLPQFAVESPEFMEGFFKGTGIKGKRQLEKNLGLVQGGLFPPPDVDLAWHVRAWGWWVLQKARADLERFYPVIDGKPTVAYLWARTVTCKNCRATIPLLKTRWLCKKDNKRVLLKMQPTSDGLGVLLGVEDGVNTVNGTAAQKREHDKKMGSGTMTQSGVTCPCCGIPSLKMDDLRVEGQAGRFGTMLTAVVVDGPHGKEYRSPHTSEIELASEASAWIESVYENIPYGLPAENTPLPFGARNHGAALRRYGMYRWADMYLPRQLIALGTFLRCTRAAETVLRAEGYSDEWVEAVTGYLAAMLDRLANQSSTASHWNITGEKIEGTFARFAFPIVWDFAEVNPLAGTSGGYASAVDWVYLSVDRRFPRGEKNQPFIFSEIVYGY